MQEVTVSAPTNLQYTLPSDFILESGEKIVRPTIQYSTYGNLNKDKSNVIWVCHALTANSDAAGWWPGLVGENCLYNPEEYFIVCANILGSCYGTAGPLSIDPSTGKHYYLSFPSITVRDMVAAHELLREHLNLPQIHTCIGGSVGGQQAIEWSIISPKLIKNLVLMATNAAHSPWGIAFNESQRMAIKADPTWQNHDANAGSAGMAAARAMALLSYRTYEAYQKTQKEDSCEKTAHFKAISYQQYQGEKLVKRFHAHSYLYLTYAMDSHNVGRGRGSIEKALSQIQSKTLLLGIESDILFPPFEQKFIQKHVPNAQYCEIDSMYGHDGFLIETQKITLAIRDFYRNSYNQK